MIKDKINNTSDLNYDAISSTHLVGIQETAKEINKLICNNLPTNEYGIDSITSKAIDTLNHNLLNTNNNRHLNFNCYTNLPDEVILKEGARVMFLNNKLFDHNICNGTIG
ncbi:4971_t:CDS:1, partial [Racocetra persica]